MSEFLTVPPTDTPITTWLPALRELAKTDLPTARRAALLRLLWQEAYFTRQGLIARTEDMLSRGCFGSSPHSTFRQDISLVRRRLAHAGYHLRYSRRPGSLGYYVEGRPRLDPHLRQLIAGSVAEVDPEQIAIYRRLTPAQRVWQLAHLSNWLRLANMRRLQRRKVA
jgi:hypothetical protein